MGLRTDYFSSYLWSILHPVQSASIQNVNTAPTIDQDSEDTTATNVHDDDHGTPHTFQMMP